MTDDSKGYESKTSPVETVNNLPSENVVWIKSENNDVLSKSNHLDQDTHTSSTPMEVPTINEIKMDSLKQSSITVPKISDRILTETPVQFSFFLCFLHLDVAINVKCKKM